MKLYKKLSIGLLAIAMTTGASMAAEKAKTDPDTGLKIAPGFEEVKTNCTVCHSAKFILLQKGDRDTWKQMIVWMQKTQGLWQFDPDTEDKILTYLAKNYPPGEASRRPNLPLTALPVNPYDKK